MPLWPFGRKKRRSDLVSEQEKSIEPTHAPSFPRNATPRAIPAQPREESLRPSSQRKRRRSADRAQDTLDGEKETADAGEKSENPFSRSSIEDITALPGARQLERSPHLRPANMHSAVIPYNLSSVPPSRQAKIDRQESPAPPKSTARRTSGAQLRKSSKQVDKALREEEIRAMSAPVPLPRRTAGHGDLQSRDSKKARRAHKSNDARGSNVSLPFQESIHSSMSGASDRRGWSIGGLDLFNPRPTVRLSGYGQNPQSGSYVGAPTLSRDGSRRNRLPDLQERAQKKDRRKIAHLADELDSTDLRVLLERDKKRKDKQRGREQEKLERKLRQRAEQRLEEERRMQELQELQDLRSVQNPAIARELPRNPEPPTAIHPALRSTEDEEAAELDVTRGREPLTPLSLKYQEVEHDSAVKAALYLKYGPESENAQNPFNDPVKEPEVNPFTDAVATESAAEPVFYSPLATPIETPMEDPILETAQAVRFSQSRMSGISTSPPRSPMLATHSATNLSPLRREVTPDVPIIPAAQDERRASDSSATKRAGTWAQFFRRGGPRGEENPRLSQSEMSSFSNTSRDSMSRQPLPSHLVGTTSQRQSGAPTRTQSRFREDLPELPLSPPESRVQSPDIIAAGHVAAARRGKKSVGSTSGFSGGRTSTPDPMRFGRTDSPVDAEGRASGPMSTSLASVDSEGSWLTGRPSKRKSNQSQLRGSVGSLSKQQTDFSGSYEDLGMPEEQYFRRLTTPNPEAEEFEDGHGAQEESSRQAEDNTLVRRDTKRRQPTLVHRDPLVKSREGLMADSQSIEAPIEGADSENASLSEYEEDDDANAAQEIAHHTAFFQQGRTVEYGQGSHARQLSSGSAKLLDIPPSRTRSRRESPDTRFCNPSGQATPNPSTPNTATTPNM